ncbi:hypothetical protein HX049_15905 [Myroides odoratimimus]|uniref:hypothetical protein n=1 Tax=Myroides odoratimimus TaxID=76832 RepID=UPI0025764038|nr:hypothetical protein [Myroides odoratimimus]MDM1398631.1 hypothetical protein [Myroides odoratimimus]
MKKNIITLLVLALSTVALAQEKDKAGLGIGTKRISKAAMLDIQATNKGVLLPRIELSGEDHKLNGGTNPDGVIVYNSGSVLEHGFYYWASTKWEKVAANSQVIEKLTELQTTLETQIKEITIIDGGTEKDISYLVSYNPESHLFTYLMPKEGGGYDKKEIDFKTAVKEEQTNTFIREIKTNVEGEDKILKYIYFSEKAITDWLKNNPNGNPIDDMPDDNGTPIDVLGVVNSNFKEIFENNTNTEIINQIIKKAPNNVWVEQREEGEFLVYLDDNNDKHEVSLENNETQTEIFKHVVNADGQVIDGESTQVLESKDLKKGDIYYSYKAEHGKTYYINMTNDVINSVQNSETLKQEIFNTVNNYTTEGGNVYYGDIDGQNLLYIVDKDNNKNPIDISKDVQKVIEETVNNSVVEKILQQTEIKIITDSVDVAVNSSIDGNIVYRGKRKIKVNHADGYDVTFIGSITAKPSDKKEVVEGGTRTVTYQDSTATIETLLSANIIDVKTKQVVVSTVTDVSVSGNELTFYFGQNGMYIALDNGDYEVVFEYTASK